MKGLPVLILAVTGTFGTAAANADTITVTTTTTASGTLDGTAFTNALVTLTLIGDTTNVNSGGGVSDLLSAATVSVAGVGSDKFTDKMFVFANQASTDGGFSDPTKGVLVILTFNPLFSTYALTSSIGPLSGPSALGPQPIPTVGGSFDISSAGTSTFTATVTPAPEPSLLLLLGTGLVGLAGAGARKKKTV